MKKCALFLLPLFFFVAPSFAGELIADIPAAFKAIDDFADKCRGSDCDLAIMDKYHRLCGDLNGEITLRCYKLPPENKAACDQALKDSLESFSNTRIAISKIQKFIYGKDNKQGIYASDRKLLQGYAEALAKILQE